MTRRSCHHATDISALAPAYGGGAAVVNGNITLDNSTVSGNTATVLGRGLYAYAATDCGITPLTGLPANFSYQTTNPTTNALTGTPNTPVDIAAGALQTSVFAFTPNESLAPTETLLSYDCPDWDPAPVTLGLNNLLLSESVRKSRSAPTPTACR